MTFCSTSKCSLPGANEKSSLVQLTEAAFFQQKYIKILRAVFIMEVTNISPEKLESASGNQSWLAGKIPPSIDDFPIKHPNRFSQIVSHEAPFFHRGSISTKPKPLPWKPLSFNQSLCGPHQPAHSWQMLDTLSQNGCLFWL